LRQVGLVVHGRAHIVVRHAGRRDGRIHHHGRLRF
jgi:hypothetical protein